MSGQLEEERTQALFRIWGMKEALSKVLKTGLSADFRVLELEALRFADGIVSCSFRNFMQYKAHSWISRGYVWALVLPAQSNLIAPEDLFALPDPS